jgi:hypothetical protein
MMLSGGIEPSCVCCGSPVPRRRYMYCEDRCKWRHYNASRKPEGETAKSKEKPAGANPRGGIDGRRFFDCTNYSKCLDYAATRWSGFDCRQCEIYKREEQEKTDPWRGYSAEECSIRSK